MDIRRALLCFAILAGPATAQAADGIYLSVAAVERASPYGDLSMIAHEGAGIATELAAYCAGVLAPRVVGDAEASAGYLARRALGVALLLDPDNRAALATDGALAENRRPPAIESAYSGEVLAQILRTRGALLLETGGATNLEMAGYFFALAAEINPLDEDAVYAWELYQLDAGPVDWITVVGR